MEVQFIFFLFPGKMCMSPLFFFIIILVSDHSGDLIAKGRGINRFVNITQECFS